MSDIYTYLAKDDSSPTYAVGDRGHPFLGDVAQGGPLQSRVFLVVDEVGARLAAVGDHGQEVVVCAVELCFGPQRHGRAEHN